MIALRSFVGARENCRRFGVALPARLRRAARAARASSRATAAPRRHDPRALATATPATTPSCSRSPRGCSSAPSLRRPPAGRASFPDGGYFVQRAGDRYLIFDCGPLGDGGHGHYDALSIEAWAGDRALVIDPGRFTYAEGEPNLRHWFRGTAAHNTVTVDGARPDAVRALALLAAERRGALPRPRDARRPRHPHRRGPLARLRGGPPAARDLRRRRLLDHRGPPDRRRAATATTCASTSRRAARASRRRRRRGVELAIRGARGDRARGRLDLARVRRRRPAPVVSAVADRRDRALRDAARARDPAHRPT